VQPSDIFRSKPRRYSDFWEACSCLGAPDEVVEIRNENGIVERAMQPNLEKLIILAVLLYCLHTFSPMRAVTAVYNGSRLKLTTDVPKMKPNRKMNPSGMVAEDKGVNMQIEGEEDVLLWIWFVLVDSWRAANDSLLPTGRELMGKLKARFKAKVATWKDCRVILERFFWNEALERRCRWFWIEAMSNR
jgi:hypothetical protein